MERNNPESRCNYEAYCDLLNKVDDLELSEAINDAVTAATNYVKTVDETETLIKLSAFRSEGADYREAVMTYDAMRRRAHENLIACVAILNRIAALYKIAAIFTGSITDRWQVADFALDLTSAIFINRSR